jgi:hypothetical protein
MRNGTTPTLHGPDILKVDPHHSHVVRVLEGTAYLTIEGDAHDHFLSPGEEMAIQAHRLTLVQGWPDARVQVV